MIKTIVIAAAGRGTRMKHLAEEQPKHLIHVAGKPFLHFLLRLVDEIGFQRIVVVTGYQSGKMEAFLDTEPYNTVVVNQMEKEPDDYGTAVVVRVVRDEVGDEPFVFINGDSLYTSSVLKEIMVDDGYSHIIGTYHPDPTHYGVLDVDHDGFLRSIVEKPKEPLSNLINLGVYTFRPEIFEAVRSVELSPRGEYEIVDAINALASQKKVKVHQCRGEWIDFGKPEDLPEVERFLINEKLV